MNAYEKAQALGLTGSDAEIVAQLQATGITASAVSLPDLLHLMNFRGMLTKLVSNQTDEKWTGTVLSMKAALIAANQTESVVALDRWLSHITNPRNGTFDTREPAHAAPFWAMRQAFGGVATMPSIADFDAVALLGGGWLFADLTEAEYTAQKTAGIADAAKNGLRERVQFEQTQFDARVNTALSGIDAGTVTSGAEILAALQISEG